MNSDSSLGEKKKGLSHRQATRNSIEQQENPKQLLTNLVKW